MICKVLDRLWLLHIYSEMSKLCPPAARSSTDGERALVGILSNVETLACHPAVTPQHPVHFFAVKGTSETLGLWLCGSCKTHSQHLILFMKMKELSRSSDRAGWYMLTVLTWCFLVFRRIFPSRGFHLTFKQQSSGLHFIRKFNDI